MGQASSGDRAAKNGSQCLSCRNPKCYEEILDGVDADRSRSLSDLAEKFESILVKAKSLGLHELVGPIRETTRTLKSIAGPSTSLPGAGCKCNEWGPDDVSPQGKWICNACGDKCQCDKSTWYIPSVNEKISYSTDPGVNEISSTCGGGGAACAPDCPCGCKSLKEKGYHVERLASANEKDDLKISVGVQVELTGATGVPLVPSKSSAEIGGEVETRRSGATCPCGCGYFQRGEFKVCPCGCGTIIEIVDDGDAEVRAGGPCCVCGSRLNDELTDCRELSRLSLATNDAGLMTAIEMLRTKCRIKDGMIAVLAEELRNSGNVDHIVENLTAPCLPTTAIDFDRSMLYEYLRSTSLPDLASGRDLSDDTVPKPTNFRIVRSILNSLFVAWDPPETLCRIRGYEIVVNGIVTSRVGTPSRSQAILTSVDLTKPTVLTLYAVATSGHISESSTITFPASEDA